MKIFLFPSAKTNYSLELRGISIRVFSSTISACNQNGNSEPRYLIAGSPVSVADVREMKAESRTVAHWQLVVDWDLQAQRPYVIVDPYDPRGLLYLSRGEYLLQSRVSLANDLTLIVVARPGSKPPTPISQNSPHLKSDGVPFSSARYFQNRANRLTWKEFKRLRHFAAMNVRIVDGMVSVSPKNIERAVIVWTRQLFHYSGVTAPERRLSSLFSLTRTLRLHIQSNGLPFVVKRLKIALFAVYSYLSGNPLETTESLGMRIRLSHGLPRFIPRDSRLLIRKGDLKWIRIWVSILNIYRALKVQLPDPETAYKTIRKPLLQFVPNQSYDQFVYFCRYVFPVLARKRAKANGIRDPLIFRYKSCLGMIIRTAAANLRSSMSLFSIILDAKAWLNRGPKNYVRQWFLEFKDTAAVVLMDTIGSESHFPEDSELFDRLIEFFPRPPVETPEEKAADKAKLDALLEDVRAEGSLSGWILDSWKLAREVKFANIPILGRLFNFGAAGGKLRTVAICDYWTQIAVKPVHDFLFDILRALGSNDATFDQQGTVDSYWARGLKPHWSYDLSAATDSIPIHLYVQVLAPFFMEEDGDYEKAYSKAVLWSRILTDRDFGIPSPRKGERFFTGSRLFRFIRYCTGQPMGAYSSWASMALVHHALVQFAHWLKDTELATNASWFDTYLVLGDDVDISQDEKVASNYVQICADFEVKIGLAKSLRSLDNFFEFANQRFCRFGNISPLSFLEEITSRTWKSRTEFAHRIAKRFSVSPSPMALFRLVTSARQWSFLIPEFSGMREPILVRFLHFILLGPLKASWHSDAHVSIASITQWLQNLNKELLEPVIKQEDMNRMDLLLVKAILAKVQQLLDKNSLDLKTQTPSILPPTHGGIPPSGAFPPPMLQFPMLNLLPNLDILGFHPSFLGKVVRAVSESAASKEFLQVMRGRNISAWMLHVLRQHFNMFDTETIRVPAKSPIAYLYILYCAYKHNEDARQQWIKVRNELRSLEERAAKRDIPAQLFNFMVKDASPLPEAILLWYKACALPQVIDPTEGINSLSFGKRPAVRPQDFACALVNEITPIIAKWTGVAVTNLPVLPAGGKGLNPKSFKRLLAFYKKAQIVASQTWHSVCR